MGNDHFLDKFKHKLSLCWSLTKITWKTSKRRKSMVSYIPNEVVKAHAIDGKTLLRAWREFKGLTQAEMASRMGISQSAYSQIERSESPQGSTIQKAALALRVDSRLLTLDDVRVDDGP